MLATNSYTIVRSCGHSETVEIASGVTISTDLILSTMRKNRCTRCIAEAKANLK
jgi:hypothetical protein